MENKEANVREEERIEFPENAYDNHRKEFQSDMKFRLRRLLLSVVSSCTSDDEQELYNFTGLDTNDIELIRSKGPLNDKILQVLNFLEISEKELTETLKIYRKNKNQELDFQGGEGNLCLEAPTDMKMVNKMKINEIKKFLKQKGVGEDLISNLLKGELKEEDNRLLRTLGFSDEDLMNLQRMWPDPSAFVQDADTESNNSNEIGLSAEGLYLKKNLGKPLLAAIKEIFLKKPYDPIEYLGHRLLHYKTYEEKEKQQKLFENELAVEREKYKFIETIEERIKSELLPDEEEKLEFRKTRYWDSTENEAEEQ